MRLQLLFFKKRPFKAYLILLLILFPGHVLSTRCPHPLLEARHSVPVAATEYDTSSISSDKIFKTHGNNPLYGFIKDKIQNLSGPAATPSLPYYKDLLDRQAVEFGINLRFWRTLLHEHNSKPRQSIYLRWRRQLVADVNKEDWSGRTAHKIDQRNVHQRIQLLSDIKNDFELLVKDYLRQRLDVTPLLIDIGCNTRITRSQESSLTTYISNCKLEPYQGLPREVKGWSIDEWYGTKYFEFKEMDWTHFVDHFNKYEQFLGSKDPTYSASHVVWNNDLGKKISDQKCRNELHSVTFDLKDYSIAEGTQIAHRITKAFASYVLDKRYTWKIWCKADLHYTGSTFYRLLMCCDAENTKRLVLPEVRTCTHGPLDPRSWGHFNLRALLPQWKRLPPLPPYRKALAAENSAVNGHPASTSGHMSWGDMFRTASRLTPVQNTHREAAFARELGELMSKLESNKTELNYIKAKIETPEDDITSANFDTNLEELQTRLFKLNSEAKSLASEAERVAKAFAKRAAEAKQETVKLSVDVQLAMPMIAESVAKSLTSLNTSVVESLKALLTGPSHETAQQSEHVGALENLNRIFESREKSADHKIDAVVAEMETFTPPEEEKTAHSEAINKAKTAKSTVVEAQQQHSQYVKVEKKYYEIEAERQVIKNLNEKLVEEIESINNTNNKSVTSFANLISYIVGEKEQNSVAPNNAETAGNKRRKKRDVSYDGHLNALTELLHKIDETMARLKKLDTEMNEIEGVDQLAGAKHSYQEQTHELLKETDWNHEFAHLAVKNVNDGNAVHDFLAEIRSFDHKNHTKVVGEQLSHLKQRFDAKAEEIIKELTEWCTLVAKSVEHLEKLPLLNSEKHRELTDGLEKMNKDRKTFIESFEFYLQTHGLANKVHKKLAKLRDTTDAAEQAVQKSMQEAMDKAAASGENFDERQIHSKLFEDFEANYKKLQAKLETLGTRHALLNKKKNGLHGEHDKNLIEQLNEIQKEIEKVGKDMHNHSSKIAGHKADALVINDMLNVEKSVKMFERETDQAEEEFTKLYEHVEETLQHEFSPEDIIKLDNLEIQFNKMKARLEEMRGEFDKLQFSPPSAHDQERAKKVRERIDTRINLVIKTMHNKQEERVKKIKEFRAYVFAHGHKNISDNELAELATKKEQLEIEIKRKPEQADALREQLKQLNKRMEEIKNSAASHHDGLHEQATIRNSLKDLESRLNSVINGSNSLITEVDHIHLAAKAEEEDRKIRRALKALLKEGSEFRKIGKDVEEAIQKLNSDVKQWAGFRPSESAFDFTKLSEISEDQLKEILDTNTYKSAESVRSDVSRLKEVFKNLEDNLRKYEEEIGKKTKGGDSLETNKFVGKYAPSKRINGKVTAKQEEINREIERLVKELYDRIKLLEEEEKQSLEEILAIEASVRLIALKDSLKAPVHTLLQIAPKLERDVMVAASNCDETFMSPEEAEMRLAVDFANNVTQESSEESVSNQAKIFYPLVEILKQNVTEDAGVLLKDANSQITILEAFRHEMMENIKANIARSHQISEKIHEMENEKERLVENYEASRRASKEAGDKASKEAAESETLKASKEASREASREASEKAERMASKEETLKESIKQTTKVSRKAILKASKLASMKEKRDEARLKEHHKQLEGLIKELLQMRKQMIQDQPFFSSPERELFLSKKQNRLEKPKCKEYINIIETAKGQLSIWMEEIRNVLETNNNHLDQPYIKKFIDLGIQIYIQPLEQQMTTAGRVVQNGNDTFINKKYEAAILKLKESIKQKNKILFDAPVSELEKILEQQFSKAHTKFRTFFVDNNGKHENVDEMKHSYKENYIEFALNYEKTLKDKSDAINRIKNQVWKYLKPGKDGKNPAINDFWPFTPEDGDLVAVEPLEFNQKLESIYNAHGNCLYRGYKELIDLREKELRMIENPGKTSLALAKDDLVQEARAKNIKLDNERDVIHNAYHDNIKSGLNKKSEHLDKNSIV